MKLDWSDIEDDESNGNDIYNATNINSTYFYQNGNLVLDSTDEANLNVNHSNSTGYIEWSGILNKFITAVDDIYVYMSGTTATLNETKLNNTIQTNPKNWTKLQNYPSACPAGTYITQLDDSVTCTAALKNNRR